MKININLLPYLAEFFLEREMFQAKIVEKIQTHFIFNHPPPPPNPALF